MVSIMVVVLENFFGAIYQEKYPAIAQLLIQRVLKKFYNVAQSCGARFCVL